METLPGRRAVSDKTPVYDLDLDLDPAPAPSSDGAGGPGFDDAGRAEARRRLVRRVVDIVVIAAVVAFVLAQAGPRNLFTATTPAGGDMGAHVWGPAFLRDHLLSQGRLTGWTPDWYAGFPAYQFYMVLPALAIVAVNVGLRGWAALVPGVGAVALGVLAWRSAPRSLRRRLLVTAAVAVGVLGIGVPYGIAFKVVSVSGLLALPVCAYLFGRLARLPFPTPAMLAVVTLVFVFNREPAGSGTGNIIGGNFTSTMAGEFSFTISLALALAYLGVLVAGLRTGRYRWLGALLLALTALCHLIPAIFAVIASLCALAVWPGRRRLHWLATSGPVAALVAAFWCLPFVGRASYLNDMGWEKSPAGIGQFNLWHILTNRPPRPDLGVQLDQVRSQIWEQFLFPTGLRAVLMLALVGVIVSVVMRIRVGLWLGLINLVLMVAFIVTPESRLWNARLLPFYYLCAGLLAALAVTELARSVAALVARDPMRPVFAIKVAAPAAFLAVVLVVVALPLRSLPRESVAPDGTFQWGPFKNGAEPHPARDWARWNYSGYEAKPAYPEYHGLMSTMAAVGSERGCGRAMWEYEDVRLNLYGTPMAPMLLPYWTDGCIGSMEGLFFEASMTTPFHFINQRELSAQCSCAQRNLPYAQGLDMAKGVEHLQLLGVRYYLAFSPSAVEAAAAHPDLSEVATSGPWHVFEVADAPLVEPLDNQPAVVVGQTDGIEWVYGESSPHTPGAEHPKAEGPAMTWYQDPERWDVFLASSGPAEWARVQPGDRPPARDMPDVEVSGVRSGVDGIAFDVDRVGAPVLVKASYFPNWKVEGADGPYRVAPNLMVVVPTSNHVSLHYGSTPLDYAAYLLTFIGIGLLVVLARRRPLGMPEDGFGEHDALAAFLAGNPDAAAADHDGPDERPRPWWRRSFRGRGPTSAADESPDRWGGSDDGQAEAPGRDAPAHR
ncbi:MAG: hypothetical protein ACT4PW_07195 [Acidimicrobiia bacterium]